MRRIAALVLVLVWVAVAVTPASAAERLTRHYLGATVEGRSVTVVAGVDASGPIASAQLVLCVRRETGLGFLENHDLTPSRRDSGTRADLRATTSLNPGLYRYYPCVRADDGALKPVGTEKSFRIDRIPGARVLFDDDFDGAKGSRPDPRKWGDYSSCAYDASAAYGRIRCGADETLDGDGHLLLPATPGWGSALSTGERFGFVTGAVTIRAKIEPERGYWPSFRGLDTDPDPDADHAVYPHGELTVMQTYTGIDPGFDHWDVFTRTGPGKGWGAPDRVCTPGRPLYEQFHDFTEVVRADASVSFYIDDVNCGWIPKSLGQGRSWGFPPDVTRPTWLIIANAVGGTYDGTPNPAPTKPGVLVVDSVRVTALS